MTPTGLSERKGFWGGRWWVSIRYGKRVSRVEGGGRFSSDGGGRNASRYADNPSHDADMYRDQRY
jgi:hypothetical protein